MLGTWPWCSCRDKPARILYHYQSNMEQSTVARNLIYVFFKGYLDLAV